MFMKQKVLILQKLFGFDFFLAKINLDLKIYTTLDLYKRAIQFFFYGIITKKLDTYTVSQKL